MSTLPCISGRDAVKALEKIGFYVKRQHGSQAISFFAVITLLLKLLFPITKNSTVAHYVQLFAK
jgi:hypothetical protein